MEPYILPQSLAVEPTTSRNLNADPVLSFGGGLLSGYSYRPLGLNSLWSLVGALASLQQPFFFEIKLDLNEPGLMGGFHDGRFCLFSPKGKDIEVVTPRPFPVEGASKVTINDARHSTFYWIPDSSMMSFEDLVEVANSVLLSAGTHYKTVVLQRFRNWIDDKYHGTAKWDEN